MHMHYPNIEKITSFDKEIINRLNQILDTLKIKQKDLAKAIFFSLSEVMTGRKRLTIFPLVNMILQFNININWLLTNEGSMFIENSKNKPLEELVKQQAETIRVQNEIIEILKQRGKVKLLSFIQKLFNK